MMKKPLLALSILTLGACAYAIDDSIQNVRIETPGAHNAACNVFVEGLKYKAKPPQTLNIFKSKDDLIVDCWAPGGRRKMMEIPAGIETSAAWNAVNAGAGLPWDYASGALFRYPDVIEVDFTDVPVTDPPLPAQNSPDIRQPETYDLEEFSPGSPRMNEDRYAPPVEVLRRDGLVSGSASSAVEYEDGSAFSEPEEMSGGKSDIQSVPLDAPIPLFPGE